MEGANGIHWRLVFLLSLFGLAMGIGTVFVISSKIEPAFWLTIFVVCAIIIAKYGRNKPFVHGLLVGIVNSIWVTGAHILFSEHYIATHAREAAMMTSMPMASPRLMMALTGPVVGLVSGVILGLFAWIATRLVKPRSYQAGGRN